MKRTAKKRAKTSLEPTTVLVLKTVNMDMTAHGGFKWPESGVVEAPDWKDEAECGNGLHGLPWAEGNWALLEEDAPKKWLVVSVNKKDGYLEFGGKCKFRRGTVIYCGEKAAAVAKVMCAPEAFSRIQNLADKKSKSSGNSSRAASSGNSSSAASSGDSSSAASSGDSSRAASSGYKCVSMAAGCNCAVKSGPQGAFAAGWYDGERPRILVGYVGEDGIKADTWYRIDVRGNVAKWVEA